MLVHLTKKLADQLKLKPTVETVEHPLYSWRANYVQEPGYRFVIFMNDATRFCIVINDAKVNRLKKLPELFRAALETTLFRFHVNPEVIKLYLENLGEFTYAKNSDPKKTAQMNACTAPIWSGLEKNTPDEEISWGTRCAS